MATQKQEAPKKEAGKQKVRKYTLDPKDKKANFKNFAGARTSKVLKALKALRNCGNKANYEATPEQLDKIEKTLQEAVTETMRVLRSVPKEKAKEFEL